MHIPVASFQLPLSNLLSEDSKSVLKHRAIESRNLIRTSPPPEVSWDLRRASIEEIPKIRKAMAKLCISSPAYSRLSNRYKTKMQLEMMAGVCTEVFTPAYGVSDKNKDRALINLHGGYLMYGSRSQSHFESIPISAVGKIKVISVDYRMAPEHHFPAASDDVLSVYKHLLKDYEAKNIGIYGSSAGALLAAQVIARIQREGLPMPAAVGMLSAAVYYWMEGDSGVIGSAIMGTPEEVSGFERDLYFKNVSLSNSEAFPGNDPETIRTFPPSLLLSSTRDFCLSSVVKTHTELTKLGVSADLHVWEGLDHVFYLDVDIPESAEVYDVVTGFFDNHFGEERSAGEGGSAPDAITQQESP